MQQAFIHRHRPRNRSLAPLQALPGQHLWRLFWWLLCGMLMLMLLTLANSAAAADSNNPTSIRFCADDAQWPPYSYLDSNQQMQGFTVELLTRGFERLGQPIEIEQLPWARCLAAVENGRQFQVALDSSSSSQRRARYRLTRAYYTLTPYYFYSRRHFPDGIHIDQGQQLGEHGTVCGLLGYNYSNFALGQTAVTPGGRDFYTLTEMLERGRCALFIGRYEIVAGMAHIGADLLADPQLAYAPIPDAEAEPFHMMVSRNIPDSEQLTRQLDSIISRMQASGELEQLRLQFMAQPKAQ